MGNAVETIQGSLINGPWDMTWLDDEQQAALFVTNVLNGTVAANGSVVNQGTVVRVNLRVSETKMPFLESLTVVGAGFSERTDPAALVIGPTGLGLSPACRHGEEECEIHSRGNEPVLYVADSVNNRVAVITDPLTRTKASGAGMVLSAGGSLNDPLGLTVAPNGHILVVNGNDGFITEITPRGAQIAKKLIDNNGNPPGAGALFGLIFDPENGVVFVDDATNTLNLLH
jgi:DNA-binding beta-propeller fold protein YncE